jgi:ATP-dependent DNA helicase RecG
MNIINDKLSTPVQYIKGVGPKRAELLQRLGVETVRDLFLLLPRRYEDRSNLKPIRDVQEGETLSISGTIAASGVQRTRTRLNIFKAAINDGTGILYATFFNQPYLKDYFKIGLKVILYGKVSRFQGRQLVMNVPEYEILDNEDDHSVHIGGIVPIYPLTENLGQKFIRTLIRNVLSEHINDFEENLPAEIRTRLKLVPLRTALWNIHFPENEEIKKQSRARMVFEEFFLFQLGVAMRKRHVENFVKGISHNSDNELVKKFEKILPFKLTNAQERVLAEVMSDMKSTKPMNRLLQGDVGSGKTVVALYSLIYAVGCGYQGALMAPTEILARQHYNTIKEFTDSLGIKIALLISDIPRDEYNSIKTEIAEGSVDVVIGTHALIQTEVEYKKLGFVVIDEQHKFGVAQRALLGKKAKIGLDGFQPDILVMTATPIPRTLALTAYGTMDLSTIDEMPPGRGKVITYWITEDKISKAYDFIRKEIAKGRQAYIVYPLIRQSEKTELRAAEEMLKKLQSQEFPKWRLGLIHGKLTSDEKIQVMQDFRDNKVDILIATTIIEVGLDVSNATVMLIEHAERFGLSQLHQLRGRIGRGSHYSYCILQGNPGTQAGQQRLKAMEATTDGFKISQEDLLIRGPGDFFGTRQHGMPEMRIGNIVTDINIMEIARKEAELLLGKDPDLQLAEHRVLYVNIKNMFGKKMETISI